MLRLEKNKGIVNVYVNEKVKPYQLDINKCQIIGLTHKPLKTIPRTFVDKGYTDKAPTALEHNLRTLFNCQYAYLANDIAVFFPIIDKISSLNCRLHFADFSFGFPKDKLTLVDKYFKTFTIYLQQYNKEYLRLNDFVSYLDKKLFKEKFAKELSCFEHEEDIDELYSHFRGLTNTAKNYLNVYIYYYKKRAYYLSSPYTFIDKFNTYIKECRLLGKEPKKTPNVGIEFFNTHETYLANESLYRNVGIKKTYDKYYNKINFSNNEFQIIMPTTVNDFTKEAEVQHNCVARLYMPEVADGNTIVCFIRKKSDIENSFITCEISIKTGQIIQYLLQFNCPVHCGTPEYEFEKEFQQFLYDQWNK